MAAYHSDEILDGASLPLRYAAFSPCFRKEAGSHGKDTKGIIRVHWFDKVEMFVYTTLEESYAEHQRLLAWEKEFLDKLELAYRVIDVAAGDLGLSAIRKFDCEAWIPTRASTASSPRRPTAPSSRPAASTSAPRADGGIAPVATLNGTLGAITRTIVAHPRDAPERRRLGDRARRRCSPYLGGSRCWGRVHARERLAPAAGRARHRRHAARVGRGRRQTSEQIAPACTTPSSAPATPAPTSCWPAAARRTA